jgi:hypothetical protein
VAVIFAYFQFGVIAFCITATIEKHELVFEANSLYDYCNNPEINYIKLEVTKITAIFALFDLLTFE